MQSKTIEQRKSLTGFTLLELLIVLAIIVLTLSIIFPSWRQGAKAISLERIAHQVAQDIARAREFALRSQEFDCRVGRITGYGIYFDSASSRTSYLLFADCNGNNRYDSVDDIVETISLERSTLISALSPSPDFSIVFVPPEPQVFIKPGDLNEAAITLSLEDDSSRKKQVTISAKGVVNIK